MKKILFIIVWLIMITAMPVSAANWFIDSTGGGDGSSTVSPYNITEINAENGIGNDVIILKSGDTFTTRMTLASCPSVTSLTVRGSETADAGAWPDYSAGKPKFDGDTIIYQCIKIDNGNIAALTLKNIAFDGEKGTEYVNYTVRIENVDGVVFDALDLTGTTSWGALGTTYRGRKGFGMLSSCTGNREIKNCTVSDLGRGTPTTTSPYDTDNWGLSVAGGDATGWIKIHDNTIHDVNGDCVLLTDTVASAAELYDNTLYNAGENSVDIKGADDFDVYQNTMYREAGFGLGGSGSEGALIVIHGNATSSDNNKIQKNYLYDNQYAGVNITYGDSGATGNTVKYNHFKNCSLAVEILNLTTNTKIYGNVFEDCYGTAVIRENNSVGTTEIYHNTIYDDSGSISEAVVWLAACNATEIHDNIIYTNNDIFGLLWSGFGTAPVVNYNHWYRSDSGNVVDYDGTEYGSANWATWQAASHSNDERTDPELYDGANGQLWPAAGSPCLGAASNTETLLDISSTWPDSVTTVADQDENGAYRIDTVAPVISGALPTGEQQCTSDPRNVDIQITTDENATCKYDTADDTYDNLSNTFTTTGTTSHSQTLSLACDASYTYYCRCKDGYDNKNGSSTSITFPIESSPPPPVNVTGSCYGGGGQGSYN